MLVLLLATVFPLRGTEHPARIFFGDAKHPVVSGEAWLIANRWGAYPAVLVGTIREGKFEQRKNIEIPQYWEQAYDYKLLLAVSDRPVEAPSSFETDDAYSINFAYGADPWPEYLKEFRTVYLSAPLAAENRGEEWKTALKGFGHLVGDKLVLPRPSRHTIRFLYPDGKPLAGTRVSVSLYGSDANHCGVVLGIALGKFVTNADGEIHVVATHSPLEFGVSYFEEVAAVPPARESCMEMPQLSVANKTLPSKGCGPCLSMTTFLTFGRRRISPSLMLILKFVGSIRQGAWCRRVSHSDTQRAGRFEPQSPTRWAQFDFDAGTCARWTASRLSTHTATKEA